MLKFRTLAIINIAQEIAPVIERHVNHLPNGMTPSCLSCEHFHEDREQCKISNDQRPPARIIAFGCPSYKDNDTIPF